MMAEEDQVRRSGSNRRIRFQVTWNELVVIHHHRLPRVVVALLRRWCHWTPRWEGVRVLGDIVAEAGTIRCDRRGHVAIEALDGLALRIRSGVEAILGHTRSWLRADGLL